MQAAEYERRLHDVRCFLVKEDEKGRTQRSVDAQEGHRFQPIIETATGARRRESIPVK